HVRRHQAALRSDMLTALNGFTEEEMTGREGREALAANLRDLVNERLEQLEGAGGIDGVFFPSFVLQ
ncbi:MAG: flagellar basal body-associated FliL family protein, partial [Roseinatronobacter sp.]|nr:flagellar basal body-associated FliL family protein [Roseinatronobacter sp.]